MMHSAQPSSFHPRGEPAAFSGWNDCLQDRRRHGDPFPLNAKAVRDFAEDAKVFEPRRALWISDSLNRLAMHDMNSRDSTVLRSTQRLNAAQQYVAERVCKSLQMSGEPPSDLTPESAVSELLASDISYDGTPNNLAAYDPDKLKVLRSQIKPKKIVRFLPPEAAKLVEHYDSQILLPDAAESEAFQPYWDPALRYDSKRRLDFILRLHRVGLVSFRRVPKSFIGAFFVKKKDPNAIRMVLDCRGTNRLHQPPPVTRLGSARCYSDLDLSNLESGQGWGIEADVNDAFYNFSVPELTHYFAFNHPLTVEAWTALGVDVSKVFDPCSRLMTPVEPGTTLFPCIEAVPMGWSWALFLCNEATLTIARSCSPWCDGIFREKKRAPQLGEFKTCLGVYVDNITILGLDKDTVSCRAKALNEAFKSADVPITWSQCEPTQRLESVGCILDFDQKILCNKPRRLWKFFLATVGLLRRNKLGAKALQVWAGHYTSICNHTPWGLSALQHIYRFIEVSRNHRVKVWPSVKREMKLACSLAWLTWRDLGGKLCRLVDVGDSSSSGYAMMTCEPGLDKIRAAMAFHEKWRFIPMPEPLKKAAENLDVESFQSVLEEIMNDGQSANMPSSRPGFEGTKYARWVIDSMKQGSWLATSSIRSQIRASPTKRVDVDVPSLIEPVDQFFAEPSNFRLLWARRWKDPEEHINVKECRVAISSLRRACRVREILGCRKLSLSDNLATVSALSKGRSSSHAMNKLCRVAAAIQFGCGITWHLRRVETKRNVADGPSRIPEKVHRGVRPCQPCCEPIECSGRQISAPSRQSKHSTGGSNTFDSVPQGPAKFFLELFSGSGNLTNAVKKCGIPCLEPIDIRNGVHCDLTRRKTQKLILRWIEKGAIGWVHLGTPCAIWSQARKGVKDSSREICAKDLMGVELALFSAEVISICNRVGVQYTIENPSSSQLFSFLPLRKAIGTSANYEVNFDLCSYGEAYKKDTKLFTSCQRMCQLERHCQHRRHSVWLKGSRRALSGVYPEKLCAKYAELVKFLGCCHGDPTVCDTVRNCFSVALRSAASKKTAGQS